ncbi:acyl-CoA dehydrogenase [Bacillus sp. FJAT-45350]|uniref:acyl-CoA dehydrogenase n=1 Tax=Bacillus sp. FJAT-45350 TaxID=2011014 RepID=UPI000BB84D26|nr:acyl-CoA dehydrogenase [Bacillus sp. FJAT-45350]
MELRLNEEQQMIKKMVREFSNEIIKKAVVDMEESDEFPLETIRKMGELGLMGIPILQKYGGTELDFISYILVINEISKVSATIGEIVSVHTSVGTNPILYFGTDEQKIKYIPKLASGKFIGAFALTEPSAGSDAANIRTTAERKGNKYIVNGSKMFISGAGAADIYITFVVTDPTKGKKGISTLIIDKDTPGFFIGKKERKMGLHGSNTCELFFENAEVPVENLLGTEGEGLKIALGNLDVGRIGIAAQSLGIAEAALEAAIQYAKERKQFGKPISAQQGLSFKLANMATKVEAAKLLVYQAADLRNKGIPCSKEASMAKCFASDTAMYVTTEAIQVFGGYGYTKEYPVERYFRDAKVTQIYEGTNEIQRLVISKHLLSI